MKMLDLRRKGGRMLIIKTQDGKIVKLEAIVIDSQVNRSIGGLTSSSVYYILGSYESEERAKEVMEKIEEHIRKQYSLKLASQRLGATFRCDIREEQYKFYRIAIYDMPKE